MAEERSEAMRPDPAAGAGNKDPTNPCARAALGADGAVPPSGPGAQPRPRPGTAAATCTRSPG